MITPIEKFNNIFLKREDLFTVGSSNGVKARTVLRMMERDDGPIVTCGSRHTNQGVIVSDIGTMLKRTVYVFIPEGKETEEMVAMKKNGANLVRISPGYKTVLVARSKKFATENSYNYIPFGLESVDTINLNSKQVSNLPTEAKRIVIACGGGMTLASILVGLEKEKNDIPIEAICVGSKIEKNLDKFSIKNWEDKCNITYINIPYEKPIHKNIGDIELDPYYESKALEYLEPNDIFWISGKRNY